MSAFTKSKFSCPSCGDKLQMETSHDSVEIWCSNGSCNSDIANEGAQALTEEAAFEILKEKI